MSTTAEEPESGGYQRFDCTDPEPDAYADAIEAARKAIEDGDCIVLPTDTVYGIGADAFSPAAVQGLLDAKHRGRDMPPPVLIAEPSLIRALATDVPQEAKDLVDEHWPGPLTVICQIQPSLRMDLGDSKDTIALRVPDHPLTREILRRTGPMAVSSANRSGQPAALTCDEAVNQLGDAVAVYLDGGELPRTGALRRRSSTSPRTTTARCCGWAPSVSRCCARRCPTCTRGSPRTTRTTRTGTFDRFSGHRGGGRPFDRR